MDQLETLNILVVKKQAVEMSISTQCVGENTSGVVDKNCKSQLTQQLKPNYEQRREFVEWIIKHNLVDADFSSKIILSDEAQFCLDGFVNRQNCLI